jgi:hypothetical protein
LRADSLDELHLAREREHPERCYQRRTNVRKAGDLPEIARWLR